MVGIVIDQFRYDYLTRFRSDYTGGIARLLEKGAVFTNATYEHVPTVTAIGHATFLSGAPPSLSGIIGNEWWDRASGKRVTSVSDDGTRILGGSGSGASPRRLLQSTIGDELKMSGKGGKVIGVSIKDRSAILPAGHMADAAYWFDTASGNLVSSTYYFPALPGWVTDFNQRRPADRYLGAKWTSMTAEGTVFRALSRTAGKEFYESLERTPFGNELIEEFAERALGAEQLGRSGRTDLLTVSFSANDYVGHDAGPDSPEVRDVTLRTDRLLDKLFRAIDAQVGLGQTLIVFTADHGVAPVPEVNQKRKMPGGRFSAKELTAAIEKALAVQFGAGRWVADAAEGSFFLNLDLIREKKLSVEEAESAAARALLTVPHVFRVYTRTQLERGQILVDRVGARVRNGFNQKLSGNILMLPEPYWMISGNTSGTSHLTPFDYDAHVPVVFLGAGVKPGAFRRAVAVHDIAPTLAALLGIGTPSGSVGRVLDEMFEAR